MHAVIDRKGTKWNFTLKQGETVIFSSSSPNPMFYGEYDRTYSSPEAAFGACRMLMFRNASIMDRVDGKKTMTEVQQGVVDGMVYRWNAFVARMKDIRHDEESNMDNRLYKTVPSLEKLLSDSIKTIDSVIPEIEGDTADSEVFDEKKKYTEHNVQNEASVYLIRIADKMKTMRSRLKKDFTAVLDVGALPEGPAPVPVKQTVALRGITRYAAILGDDPDLLANMLADTADAVKNSLGGGYVRHIERTCDDGWLFLVKTTRGEFGVRIGDDALFRGMFPAGTTCSKYPYMSLSFWNDVMKPAMGAVGHWFDPDTGYLMLPETVAASARVSDDDSRTADVLKAFNTKTGEKCACEIISKRGRHTKGDICRVRPCSTLSRAASTSLEARINRLKDATMVRVTAPGSKYYGVAGPMDPERMKVRNDYVEIPVRIQFDTGLETEVWMADEDVEVFMEGGDGTPQQIQ